MRKEVTTMVSLIKLTENDKKLIIVLLLIFILLFVIVGYFSLLVKKIMDRQGSKADTMMKNVVEAKYFDNEKAFVKFGIRKNIRLFYKEARIPFIIMLAAWIAYVLFCLFSGKWGYNPFNRTDGFGTLIYEFGEWPKTKFFGLTIINGFPPVITAPHWEWSAWFSYLFVPVQIVAVVWFLIYTQAYIARSLRIYKMARGIYRKKLDADPAPTSSNNQ